MIKYINALPKDERYGMQSDVLHAMLQAHNAIDNSIKSFFIYAKDSYAYRLHITDTKFAKS